MGESLARVGDVDAVALEPPVYPFDIRSFGPVGVLPAGVEVVPVLTELVELAEVTRTDRDRRLLADPRQFLPRQGPQAFGRRDGDGRFGRGVCGGGPPVGEVHDGRPWCGDLVDLVEARAGHCGRGPAGGALESDRATLVRGFFEAEEVRLAGGDLLAKPGVVVDAAYVFVIEAEGGLGQSGGHGGACEGSVDQQGAVMGALDASVLLLVVEDELVAEAAGGWAKCSET
ncbi:hypothetical protein ABZX75_16210 [Streptomyces sp. NPDC003038]|uniref:hypothetical protein n=1 Tax=unclassified Streptomyces TaxID=2593676 RepID=UPI0033BA634D